ncbi:MAG: DUF2938 family protein [Rhodobacteraceae bacterium]|nr:MAG: DUF2938 family protein [Paracoccaceae bacterium]
MTILTFMADAVPLGTGATLFMDVLALLRQRLWQIPSLDYALVGRWGLGMARGWFRHRTILDSPPVAGERPVGWALHYLIGIGFAALLLLWLGAHRGPAELAAGEIFGPAMFIGAASVLLPYCVMQPAFGFGFAAARSPRPGVARWRSLVAHLSFGLGLFLAALIWNMVARPL